MATHLEQRCAELAATSCKAHPSRDERSALRCAFGDAAAILDILSDQTRQAGKITGGRIRKRAQEDAALFKRAGDIIWEMRSRITNAECAPTPQEHKPK